MRNACPTCQTVYAVTPADVGRRIVCTRCNAGLVIDEDGFRLLDSTDKGKPAVGSKAVPPPGLKKPAESRKAKADETEDDEETVDSSEVKKPLRDRRDEVELEKRPGVAGRLRSALDLPTVVFAVGVVLVLWFLFMPLIGAAKLRWYTARIEDEQLAHDTELKRLKEKGPAESVPKKEEEWRKRKEKLDTDVQWVQINNRQSEYWDRYGMLGGFILTALGAIGLLMSHQPLVKKIVGAVVVCAMMILVFVNFAWKG